MYLLAQGRAHEDTFRIAPTYILDLQKKGLLKDGKPTKDGEDLLYRVGIINEVQVFNPLESEEVNRSKELAVRRYEVEVNENPDFIKFWNAYPLNDGRNGHLVTRVLRWNKAVSRDAYARLISQGATPEELMRALQNEIKYRDGITTPEENGFKYMQASSNYLLQGSHVKFLDYDTESTKPQIDDYGKELD